MGPVVKLRELQVPHHHGIYAFVYQVLERQKLALA
jgi:hypothetical protein